MVNYEGLYYDGHSAEGHMANISLESDHLLIVLAGEEKQDILWDYDGIRRGSEFSRQPVMLKFGPFPHQTLEIRSDSFLKEVRKHSPKTAFSQEKLTGVARLSGKALMIAIASTVGFLALCYFYLIPLSLGFVAMHFPKGIEEQLGEKMLGNFINVADVDTARTIEANHFYYLLRTNSQYHVHITVVKSNIKNAFALPGGQIVVFSAILEDLKHSDELVALLGHELGHIEKRHTLKMMFQNFSNYLLLAAIFQNSSGITSVLVNNVASLHQLSYSRKLEAESDDYGYSLMLQNHVDPQGMVDLFENLKKTDNIRFHIPEFLTTHPALDTRILTIKGRIKEQGDYPPYPLLENSFTALVHK